jgi:ankyrin repeat protein
LENGANVAAVNNYGTTPLHLAEAEAGFLKIAELLLKNGADVAASDIYGSTPLSLARSSGSESMAKLLLKNCADVSNEAADLEQPVWSRNIGPRVEGYRIRRSPTLGGSGGNFFNDMDSFRGSSITRIRKIVIRHCYYIDSLQVCE